MTEPTYTEGEIRAAFAAAPYGPDAKAWLTADYLLASLRAAVESPVQPPATHEHFGSGGSQWCDRCGESPDDPVHVQRGADTPQPDHTGITSIDDLAEHLGYGELPLPDEPSAVRGADVPTTEISAEITSLYCEDCDEEDGVWFYCIAHQPSAGTSPTTAEEPTDGLGWCVPMRLRDSTPEEPAP